MKFEIRPVGLIHWPFTPHSQEQETAKPVACSVHSVVPMHGQVARPVADCARASAAREARMIARIMATILVSGVVGSAKQFTAQDRGVFQGT